jgi:hypothetical protein
MNPCRLDDSFYASSDHEMFKVLMHQALSVSCTSVADEANGASESALHIRLRRLLFGETVCNSHVLSHSIYNLLMMIV